MKILFEKHFHILLLASGIAEIICIYKSTCLIQKTILVIEVLAVFLILEYEASRLEKYNFYEISSIT